MSILLKPNKSKGIKQKFTIHITHPYGAYTKNENILLISLSRQKNKTKHNTEEMSSDAGRSESNTMLIRRANNPKESLTARRQFL